MEITRHTDENGWRWYRREGKPDLISVTAVLDVATPQTLKSWLSRTSENKQKKVKTYTANLGTLVHEAIEKDLKGESFDLAEEIKLPFEKWLELKEKHKIQAIATELMVASYRFGFAGTVDIVGWFDGKLCIMDVKTGFFGVKAGWQMGLYRLAHLETDTMKNELGLVGLSIKRDGTSATPFVYEHVDYVTRAGLHTLEVFKALYYGKLVKMSWPYLEHNALKEYWNV